MEEEGGPFTVTYLLLVLMYNATGISFPPSLSSCSVYCCCYCCLVARRVTSQSIRFQLPRWVKQRGQRTVTSILTKLQPSHHPLNFNDARSSIDRFVLHLLTVQ